MKILFVIDSLGYGGKEKQLYNLIKNLPKEIDKQLIVLSERILFEDIYCHIENLTIVKKKDKYKLKSLIKLYETVISFRPDIIHCWDSISPLIFFPYSVLKKTKLINGSIRTSRPIKRFSWNYVLKWFNTKITCATVSNSKQGLRVVGLLDNKKATYIHNGFDLALFDEQMNGSCCYLPADNLHVVMVGRFYPAKDFNTLLKTANIVNKEKQCVVFHLVGDGPMKKRTQVLAEQLGLQNIIFHGNRSDVPGLLVNCDIGVLLNPGKRAEGLPNAVMEYMAARLPVVATNAGGTPELVKDGVNGFLVQPEDHNEVAEKTLELINNKEKRVRFGRQGRKIIEQRFSVVFMMEAYINLYKDLLNQ